MSQRTDSHRAYSGAKWGASFGHKDPPLPISPNLFPKYRERGRHLFFPEGSQVLFGRYSVCGITAFERSLRLMVHVEVQRRGESARSLQEGTRC